MPLPRLVTSTSATPRLPMTSLLLIQTAAVSAAGQKKRVVLVLPERISTMSHLRRLREPICTPYLSPLLCHHVSVLMLIMASFSQTHHAQRALLALSDGESPGCYNRGSLSGILAFLFPKGIWRHAENTNVGHNSTAESGCRSSSLETHQQWQAILVSLPRKSACWRTESAGEALGPVLDQR